MPKRNDGEIKVVPVKRNPPDLQRLAKAIVALALQQLEQDKHSSEDDPKKTESDDSKDPGAAA